MYLSHASIAVREFTHQQHSAERVRQQQHIAKRACTFVKRAYTFVKRDGTPSKLVAPRSTYLYVQTMDTTPINTTDMNGPQTITHNGQQYVMITQPPFAGMLNFIYINYLLIENI